MIVQNVQGNVYNPYYKYSSRPINNTQNINFNGLGFLKKTRGLVSDVFIPSQTTSQEKFAKSINNIWDKINNHPSNMTAEKLENAITTVKNTLPDTSEKAILLTMQRLTQWANYTSFETLGKKLNELDAGQVFFKENDLFHQCLDYFIDKKGILGNSIYNSYYSTYLTKSNLDMFQTQVGVNKYINLEGFDDGVNFFTDDNLLASKTIKTIKKVKKKISENPNMMYEEALSHVLNDKIIQHAKDNNLTLETITLHNPATREVILEQMRPCMPSSENEIISVIDILANWAKPETPEKLDFLKYKIAQFFEKNLEFFTKQDLIKSLKNINLQIKNFSKAHNIDEKNIYYLIPRSEQTSSKSFGVITHMYKELFQIPNDKIKRNTFYYDINSLPDKSAIVILDDATISGESLIYAGDYIDRAKKFDKNKHILFCPLISYENGLKDVNAIIKKLKRDNIDVTLTSTILKSPEKYSLKNKLYNMFFQKNEHGKLVFDYYPQSRDANEKFIVLPYMSPDNNASLATILTQLFIPNHKTAGNAAIKNIHISISKH